VQAAPCSHGPTAQGLSTKITNKFKHTGSQYFVSGNYKYLVTVKSGKPNGTSAAVLVRPGVLTDPTIHAGLCDKQ